MSLLLVLAPIASSQPTDSLQIAYIATAKQILTYGLSDGKAYPMLREFCTTIGNRLSGSVGDARGIDWLKKKMEQYNFENVRLEPVTVPKWVRGTTETAFIVDRNGKKIRSLRVASLGMSIPTPTKGVTAEILEVITFKQLDSLGPLVKGKIVFFNRAFDRTIFNTFPGYGATVDQRSSGAARAAAYGAVAVLVRSVTPVIDDHPHTGTVNYTDSLQKIPAAAVSTRDAEVLSEMLKSEKAVRIRLTMNCHTFPDAASANVIGELRGSERPNEIILIGGHHDSWDKGQGAHDDGAGCIHVIEAIRILKELNIRPRRTIRAVMFANEENGLRGGKAYAAVERPNEIHLAAIESDVGGFAPTGFTVQGTKDQLNRIAPWSYLFTPMEADRITNGGSGADISPLVDKGVLTIGLRERTERYFEYHHAETDVIGGVNERELQLGACALAIMAWILAEEGI
jgi:hypothetical protein